MEFLHKFFTVISIIAVAYLASIARCNNHGSSEVSFTRVSNMDGYNCPTEDLVFSMRQVRSKVECMKSCSQTSGCRSVFYAAGPPQPTCHGCSDVYPAASSTHPLLTGSTYYTRSAITGGNTYQLGSWCYFVVETRQNYHKGKGSCHEMDGYPVNIDTAGKMAYLKLMLYSRNISFAYIGLTQHSTRYGTWVWSDTNQHMVYDNWAPGQPDGGTIQQCAAIHQPDDYAWHDQYCSQAMAMICQNHC